MSETKTPPTPEGINPLLIALIAFVAGVALMYGIGLYLTQKEAASNARIDDAG